MSETILHRAGDKSRENATSHQESGGRYLKPIDGLRAVAVCSVVLYHAGAPGFSGGFVGVDIFLVISGYLITKIILESIDGGTFTIKNFLARRSRRILPALFTTLIVTSIAGFAFLTPEDLMSYGRSLVATALYGSNFKFRQEANYFDVLPIDKPLLHTWSLGVEEQFYIVWPLLLIGLTRVFSKSKLPFVILALALVSLILAELRLPDHQKDAFYLPWLRAWELWLGAALAAFQPRFRSDNAASLAMLFGAVAVCFAVVTFDADTRFPGIHALPPTVGAALVIAGSDRATLLGSALSSQAFRFIGLISYSLYLVHWPVFVFGTMLSTSELDTVSRLGLVIVSVVLAFLSWRYVEQTARAAVLADGRVLQLAIGATLTLAAVGAVFWAGEGFASRFPSNLARADAWGWQGECIPANLPTKIAGEQCKIGVDKGAKYDFVLWGDSHAYHYAPAIHKKALERGLSGLFIVHGSCAPMIENKWATDDCLQFNKDVAKWIETASVPYVLLGGRWLQYAKQMRDDSAVAVNRERTGLGATIAFLKAHNKKAVLLDQPPEYPWEVSKCVRKAVILGRSPEPCVQRPRYKLDESHRFLTSYFAELRSKFDIEIATGNDAFCGSTMCVAMRDDVPLLYDSHHLTLAGANLVVERMNISLFGNPFAR